MNHTTIRDFKASAAYATIEACLHLGPRDTRNSGATSSMTYDGEVGDRDGGDDFGGGRGDGDGGGVDDDHDQDDFDDYDRDRCRGHVGGGGSADDLDDDDNIDSSSILTRQQQQQQQLRQQQQQQHHRQRDTRRDCVSEAHQHVADWYGIANDDTPIQRRPNTWC